MDEIYSFLLEIGVPAYHSGLNYLHDAIEYAMHKPKAGIINVCKDIGEAYNTNYQNVERCIRYSIKIVLRNGNKELMRKIFGNFQVQKDSIRNSDFIAMVSLYLGGR